MTRGGKRIGAGRKPGSVKPLAEKHVVRKLYRWTKDEYRRIKQAVQKSEIIESQFVRLAVMEKIETILNDRQDGEQRNATDETQSI